LKMYKSLGYDPIFVPIKWKYKTIDDWVEQVSNKISKNDLQQSLLSGFSFGSMIALTVAANYINPKKLLLFSLSPYFAEDFPLHKKYEKYAGKRRVTNFKKLSMDDLARKINCPTILFAGTVERQKYGDDRDRAANKAITGSKYIVVPDVGHDVGDPLYVSAIKRYL